MGVENPRTFSANSVAFWEFWAGHSVEHVALHYQRSIQESCPRKAERTDEFASAQEPEMISATPTLRGTKTEDSSKQIETVGAEEGSTRQLHNES